MYGRITMPKSPNQKLKLMYLTKIFLELTDETHSITMTEIIEALSAYGHKCGTQKSVQRHRKSEVIRP